MSSKIRIRKTCLHCGEDFIAKTTVTKYCGDTCSKRAYKKRKRLEALQAVDTPNKSSPPQKKGKDFLSIRDACALLGISRMTLYRAIKKNSIIPIRFGRRVLIKKDDLYNL